MNREFPILGRDDMRFLVKATMPVEAGNALVRNPNMGKIIEDILSGLKP